jgi:hypothetical protein
MVDSKHVVEVLRRDATYAGRAVAAIIFIGFAAIVVAAALYDLMAIHR